MMKFLQVDDIEMKTIVSWQLPIKTASEANSSEHWTKKAKRHRLQKKWVKAAYHCDRPPITLPVHVVLTRLAPRRLDCQDNLPCSLKYIVDAIAEELTGNYVPGRADDDRRITWEYKQEKGKPKEYAVKIEILKNE
jgi:hypothetical protein